MPSSGLTFRGLLVSEWIKFWSVRSTVVALVLAALLIVGIGVLLVAVAASSQAGPGSGAGPVTGLGLSMTGAQISVLVVAALGVVVVTGEYSSGLVRTSIASVPKRLPLLWAKAVVLTVVVVVTMGASILVAFVLSRLILTGAGVATSVGWFEVCRVLGGNLVVLVGVALAGLGIGSALRSAAVSITVIVVLLLVLPGVLAVLPSFPGHELLGEYYFANATNTLTSTSQPVAGRLMASGLAFAAWVGAFLTVGALALRARDVP